jgi:hypothetical protein
MANRTARIVGGTVAAVAGTLVAAGGGATMALVGSDDRFTTGRHDVTTATAALVADVDEIDGTGGIATVLGRPPLRLAARATDTPVFIGVGRADAVEAYLAGVRVDRVDDVEVSPFGLDVTRRDGAAPAAAAPGSQTFWVAQAAGNDPSVDWAVRDGDYRVVLMNADGTPRVAATARFGLVLPRLYEVGVGALGAGALLASAGAAVLVLGRRTARRRTSGPPAVPSEPVSAG